MGSKPFNYILTFGSTKVFLFESQFQFLTEEVSLSHYEKGLAKGLFEFDRSRVNQIWAELSLWGLIGRVNPVELVRVLCAFGCNLVVEHESDSRPITKSFNPVTYLIPMTAGEQPHYRHLYHRKLGVDSHDQIPFFLELSGKLVIGSYYTTTTEDVDSQFPIFCRLLESDMCFQHGCIRQSLLTLFNEGLSITSDDGFTCRTLAKKNDVRDVICGDLSEQTLFYIAEDRI